MIIRVSAAAYAVRGGIGLSIDSPRLAAHGATEAAAVEALAHVVEVWALNYQKGGDLTQALRRASINYHDDAGPLSIEVRVAKTVSV